jgi:hypothetical protein
MESIKTITHNGQEINAAVEISFCGYGWKGYGTFEYKFNVYINVEGNSNEEEEAFLDHDSQFYDEFKVWSCDNTFSMTDEDGNDLLNEQGEVIYTNGAGNELNYTSYESMVARLEDLAADRFADIITGMAIALHEENLETANEDND